MPYGTYVPYPPYYHWHGGHGRRRGAIVNHHMATDWWQWGYETQEPVGECKLPTVPLFRARFPEFAEISEAQIAMAIEDASCWADGSWMSQCCDCTRAMMFLTAHFLTLQKIAAAALCSLQPCSGEPGGSGGTVLQGGQVTSLRFETMGVSFSAPQFAADALARAGGAGGQPYSFASTPYGQMFLDLLKVNQPAVMVV